MNTTRPFWHGTMTDRGTVFYCRNILGRAICYSTERFWAMSYADRENCPPKDMGRWTDRGILHADGNPIPILVRGRG